ncbi:MAG: transcription antitermination factor NusB [Planctomycetota bacterium]
MGGSVAQLCRAELFADADGEQMEQPDKLGATVLELVEFAARLVEGTITHRESIDQRLQSVTRNWDLKRMAGGRCWNVLPHGRHYELLHCADVPPKVAINRRSRIGEVLDGQLGRLRQ